MKVKKRIFERDLFLQLVSDFNVSSQQKQLESPGGPSLRLTGGIHSFGSSEDGIACGNPNDIKQELGCTSQLYLATRFNQNQEVFNSTAGFLVEDRSGSEKQKVLVKPWMKQRKCPTNATHISVSQAQREEERAVVAAAKENSLDEFEMVTLLEGERRKRKSSESTGPGSCNKEPRAWKELRAN